jgi:hypothetical protein
MPWWEQDEGLVRVRVKGEKEDDDGRSLAIAAASSYKGCVKKVFPPLHVDACAVSQLPRHLLGRFLSLQYLAVVN